MGRVKICIITGSLPPDPCGVGDYTYRLFEALLKKGVEVKVFLQKDWSFFKVLNLKKELKSFDVVHIQYPTLGYGYSLGPHLLSLLKPMVITIHEASQAHLLRFLSLMLFTFNSKHMVFTSEFERNYFLRFFPYISNKSSIIPIGSNIPFEIYSGERKNEVVYFGLIAPKKNLEDFIELAKLIKENNVNITCRIIGKVRDKNYYEEIYRKSISLPIIWSLELGDKEVAQCLSQVKFAYLPFPDGASERRGSLLATLGNGVVTITKKGKFTTKELEESIVVAQNSLEAFYALINLLERYDIWKDLSERGKKYAYRFSWEYIADKHIELYQKLLS